MGLYKLLTYDGYRGQPPAWERVAGQSGVLNMGMLFTFFTASGPIIGSLGYFFDLSIIFWIGVILAGVNLLMNGLSGAMNFPLLPLLFIFAGGWIVGPWYAGAGVGLLTWTAIEGAGELVPSGLWWPRASK